ncbi:hypothetical protein JTE90_014985 [Oedothorax gibbosus]|uniref:Uncharacterized protein n=1 Tax=Oedothorax gibbosus TaxID=931172 RepID=A0AAV6UYV4_9ARAC|nr:hypothetical protein JTE90_014985 [Oedothorax gibbosus]
MTIICIFESGAQKSPFEKQEGASTNGVEPANLDCKSVKRGRKELLFGWKSGQSLSLERAAPRCGLMRKARAVVEGEQFPRAIVLSTRDHVLLGAPPKHKISFQPHVGSYNEADLKHKLEIF